MKKLPFEKMERTSFQILDVTKMRRVKGGATTSTGTVIGNKKTGGTTSKTDGTACQDGLCHD